MRFHSQISKRRIVIQNAKEQNRVTGETAVPMVKVSFENGIADVTDEALVRKLLEHPRYGLDFVSEDEAGAAQLLHRKTGAAMVQTDLVNNVRTQVPQDTTALEAFKSKILAEVLEASKAANDKAIAAAVSAERARAEEEIAALKASIANAGVKPVEPEADETAKPQATEVKAKAKQ